MELLFKTINSLAPTLASITLGLVMFPHGAQKALGLFGGYGFQGTMNWFAQQLHIPTAFGVRASGNQKCEGFEYHLLAICLALIVMMYGAGRLSVDSRIAEWAAKGASVRSTSAQEKSVGRKDSERRRGDFSSAR